MNGAAHSTMDWSLAKELREQGMSRAAIGRIVGRDESSVRRAESRGWKPVERSKPYKRKLLSPPPKQDQSYNPPIYRCRECGSDLGKEHHFASFWSPGRWARVVERALRDGTARPRRSCPLATPGRMVNGTPRPALVEREHCNRRDA